MLLSLFKKALKAYSDEFIYFLKAKRFFNKSIKARGKNNKNQALFIRKRAHHLERWLFRPKAYPKDFGAKVYQDLKWSLKRIRGRKNSPLINWAKKIMAEYRNRVQGEAFSCPMLKNKVKRRQAALETKELLELMRQRRSRRVFDSTPLLSREKELICAAAQAAPSSCNRQTLDLIFVEEPKLKKFIASTIPGGSQFFGKAPAIIVFISNAGDYRYPEDRTVPFSDAAAAIQNIYLLCETTELGCCWGSYSSFGNIYQEAEVRARLKIPSTHLIVGSLAIGKSSQFVCEIPRDRPQKRYWNNQYGKK